jgi:hypothetical protein
MIRQFLAFVFLIAFEDQRGMNQFDAWLGRP